MKISFGTAGNIDKDILSSIKRIKELGLDSQEVEFVRGVTMGNDLAKKAGALAKEHNIKLSIHAPFYVNLSSEDPEKIEASKKRILDSCERAHHLGVTNVVFHAGYYMKRDPNEVYDVIKKAIIEMQEVIKQNGWNDVKLSPETTGKKTQFGSLTELLKLRSETNCSICVDFAHLLARDGSIDYSKVFEELDESGIKKIHCHFSGIIYGDKGEIKHRLMEEEDFLPLVTEAIKHDIDLNIINESPDPLQGALDSREIYQNILKNNL